MSQAIRIAVDAMGGDHAPQSVITAAAHFMSHHKDVELHLFGDAAQIEPLLDTHISLKKHVYIHHTDSVVSNEEKAGVALRSGRDSSMRLAINSVKEGQTDAVISSGNTGALMAMSKFVFKTMPNVTRPAIAAMVPKIGTDAVMLDLGANSECTAQNLLEFAVMGEVFAQVRLGIDKPRIGLLNIGSEQMKGNDVVREADEFFRATDFQGEYVGFVEGDTLTRNETDVIVVDGFSGNIALKTAEGIAKLYSGWMREAYTKNIFTKCIAFLSHGILKDAKKHANFDNRNGAMFLGLKHICVKSHGGANAHAFEAALKACRTLVKEDIIKKLSDSLEAEL